MNSCNEFRSYGLSAMGIVDTDSVNRILIEEVNRVFDNTKDSLPWRILNDVLEELFSKMEAIEDGRSTAFRMFAVFCPDAVLTQKRNDLIKSLVEKLSPYWKYKATIRDDILKVW